MKENRDILKGLAAGAVGGLVATFVMTQFQNALARANEAAEEKDGKKKKAEKKEEGDDATVKTAEAISEKVFNHKLKKSEKKPAGSAVHYIFGTTMGAVYGAAAEAAPITTAGYGLGFGTGLFIGADEIAVPAFGLSESPTDIPVSTHIYGLTSHIVYGLTLDAARRAVRKLL